MTDWIIQAFGMILDNGYRLIVALSILCLIFIPLGIWKSIDLIIWLFKTIAPTP